MTLTVLYMLLPRSIPSCVVVNSSNGRYTQLSSPFSKCINPPIFSCDELDLNFTFFLIHSAHSLAMAFCDSLFLNFISKSVPYRLRSRFSFGIKNSLFSFFTFSAINVGDVKINLISSMLSSSFFRASKA